MYKRQGKTYVAVAQAVQMLMQGQVDLPDIGKSGLADAVNKLEGIHGLSMIRFGAGDVVRHPLVGKIVEAYEGPDA